MKAVKALSFVVVVITLFLGPAWGETVFETFAADPFGAGWTQVGTEMGVTYDAAGYVRVSAFRTVETQRFTMPLSTAYNGETEFWCEFDFRPEALYEWPRAYVGVYDSGSGNETNLLAAYYQRLIYSTEVQYQRGIGKASDGTSVYFAGSNYVPPTRTGYDCRTRLHYYVTPAGEGYMDLTITDLSAEEVVSSGSGKVLDAGKTLAFDVLGFANSSGAASSSPQWFDRMRFDNLYFSTEEDGDSYFAGLGQSRPFASWIGDTTPPQPDPMTWSVAPAAVKPTQITMTATTAVDAEYDVEYSFENVTDPSHVSGWQSDPTWTDTGLADDTEYTYRVKARDISPNKNETDWSEEASATTPVEWDEAAPQPDPMTWQSEPAVVAFNGATMTATTAVDAEGNGPVEYYFSCVTDAGFDSGWQTSTSYIAQGLQYDTEYSFAVKARDVSANYNETGLSSAVAVQTEAEPALTAYLRKSLVWHCPGLGIDVAVDVYFKEPNTPVHEPVVLYVRNHGYPRVGQEPDTSILLDFINERFIVVSVDFGGNAAAVSPELEWDLLELRRAVYGYGTASILADADLLPLEDYEWVVPAGCRLERDVVYFELDKHGSYGTKERVLNVWNGTVRDLFGVPVLSDPDDMYRPDGSPLDYKLYLDIIYPSQPSRALPLYFLNATQSKRMRTVGVDRNSPHMSGFAMRGYATAIIDHCWNPLARHDAWGYFDGGYTLDDWNGLKSATAAVRFFRAHAGQYGIDPEHICGWGYSKGAYGITRLSDPNHIYQDEYYTFTGYPEGSPEPQPWQGYSSEITAGYQAVGNGTRRLQYVTNRQVPTAIACGRFDQYNQWLVFPELVGTYESRDVNHLALWMQELAHELPYGYDPYHDRDRYALLMRFFDQYLQPVDYPGPAVLYTFPIDGQTGVTCKGWSPAIPEESLLPAGALDHVRLREPITVHFAGVMDVASVVNGGVEVVRGSDGAPVAGTWTVLRGNTMFQFEPSGYLQERTAYRVVVTTGVRNEAGVALAAEESVEFETGSMVSVDDLAGLISRWLQNVPMGDPYDADGSGFIDMKDYASFAGTWTDEQ